MTLDQFKKFCISIHSPHTRGDSLSRSFTFTGLNFNPLPSYEGRQIFAVCAISAGYFNPLPSYEGRPHLLFHPAPAGYFNPLPSYEGRHLQAYQVSLHMLFQSTPLIRGETLQHSRILQALQISIHSPHARGDMTSADTAAACYISIHSPHARGDFSVICLKSSGAYFNPLPSCEGRLELARTMRRLNRFQSTPLMRGETFAAFLHFASIGDFNPLPSCEGRH